MNVDKTRRWATRCYLIKQNVHSAKKKFDTKQKFLFFEGAVNPCLRVNPCLVRELLFYDPTLMLIVSKPFLKCLALLGTTHSLEQTLLAQKKWWQPNPAIEVRPLRRTESASHMDLTNKMVSVIVFVYIFLSNIIINVPFQWMGRPQAAVSLEIFVERRKPHDLGLDSCHSSASQFSMWMGSGSTLGDWRAGPGFCVIMKIAEEAPSVAERKKKSKLLWQLGSGRSNIVWCSHVFIFCRIQS